MSISVQFRDLYASNWHETIPSKTVIMYLFTKYSEASFDVSSVFTSASTVSRTSSPLTNSLESMLELQFQNLLQNFLVFQYTRIRTYNYNLILFIVNVGWCSLGPLLHTQKDFSREYFFGLWVLTVFCENISFFYVTIKNVEPVVYVTYKFSYINC